MAGTVSVEWTVNVCPGDGSADYRIRATVGDGRSTEGTSYEVTDTVGYSGSGWSTASRDDNCTITDGGIESLILID